MTGSEHMAGKDSHLRTTDEQVERHLQGSESIPHESLSHENAQFHHHHSHADGTMHAHGHHLLQVEDLTIAFRMYDPTQPYFSARQVEDAAIRGLSVSVHVGEIVAVVGASGSGKSLLADAIMGLYEPNALVIGKIWFDGKECSAAELARLRGHDIAYIPQSVASLDPLMKVGKQFPGIEEWLCRYGLDAEVANLYPHQLSGGMARRVLLCQALMLYPRLIVADEPTPGLDLELAELALSDLRSFADEGGAVMLITHDIELALRVADRVAVFKDGTVVEETAVTNFADPALLRHPFTRELWHALPEHGFTVPDDADA